MNDTTKLLILTKIPYLRHSVVGRGRQADPSTSTPPMPPPPPPPMSQYMMHIMEIKVARVVKMQAISRARSNNDPIHLSSIQLEWEKGVALRNDGCS